MARIEVCLITIAFQTLFYDLPRLLNASSDEYITPQMFEKFGFKESNSHPLKLLNSRTDEIEGEVAAPILAALERDSRVITSMQLTFSHF